MSLTERIRSVLSDRLAPTHLEVVDDSARHAGHAGARAGGSHFVVTVVSEAFAGRGPVERHRMVYDLLQDELRGPIHALALTTRTPAEWAAARGNSGGRGAG